MPLALSGNTDLAEQFDSFTRRILDIELQVVQERILTTLSRPFVFSITEAGKEFLLQQGTNLNYGARYLKRAIDRLVVQPISNLIATDQIVSGDAIRIDHPPGSPSMDFSLEGEALPLPHMTKLTSYCVAYPAAVTAAAAAESAA